MTMPHQLTNIVGVLPPVADVEGVVFAEHVVEPLEQIVALVLGYVVDVGDMRTNGEDTLPPSHGMGTHDRVNGLDLRANILRGAALLAVNFKAVASCGKGEQWLVKSRGERFQKLLISRAEAVVDLVSRAPEGIWEDRLAQE
jgi:hypothetical protein